MDRINPVNVGFLSYKAVSVEFERDGRTFATDVLWVWSDGSSRIFGWVAAEYADVVRSPTDIRLTRNAWRRLERDFDAVTPTLAFSRPGSTPDDLLRWDWYAARASRADFNRVQFGDRAAFVFRFPRVHLLDVREGRQGDPSEWDHRVRTMDGPVRDGT